MTPKEYQFAPFRLDVVNQCLWRGTDQISLSPKAFSVLLFMAERPGRLITKQELLDAVWADIHVTEGVLKRAVLEIRKALGDPVEEPRFIQTLHRRGYRFLAPIAKQTPRSEPKLNRTGMVGRAKEFVQLDDWFEDALSGSRQVAFITGEPGLGKTTLIDGWMRTVRQSQQSDVAIVRGRCLQQFGSGEPYLPVFEALDQLGQALGARLVNLLRSRAPTWLMHMPALISLEDRARLRDEVFGSTRERMLREITDALDALTAEVPVVIALEDLHWSDPSTVDLLSSIARRTAPARLMILGTYRPADAGPSLLAAQNELELHHQCKVLRLAYLTESETGEYLAARFPEQDSREALAGALHQRTNGNPLYVVSLVDELERSGGIDSDPGAIRELVPDTLQQMFERQAGQLTQPEQEMLAAAAVAGETFAVAEIAAGLGSEAALVETNCEALVRRHVILKRGPAVRYPDGAESHGYAFVHALCRDALARQIPPGQRSRLHGLLGQAEEQHYAADPKRVAGELAGRFELAADFSRAVHYLRMAATSAAERCSLQEAAQYLERAFGIVGRLRQAEQISYRMDLLEQRAVIRLSASDMPGSASDFEELASVARAAGAVDRLVKALLSLVLPRLFADQRNALAAIDEAQAAIAGAPDPILQALVDAYRSFFDIYLTGWRQELADQFHTASETLAQLPDPCIRCRIAAMASAVHALASEFTAACQKAEESRRESRKAGVYYDYFVATLYLNGALLYRGDLGQAMRIAREGAELAVKNGSPLSQRWFTMRQNWVRIEAFDFEEPLAFCERIAPEALTYRPYYPALLWLGLSRLGVGNFDGAWEALEKLRLKFDGAGVIFQFVCPMMQAQAECEIGRGNLDHAKSLALQVVQVAGKHRDFSYAARGYLLLAEIANSGRDFEVAAEYLSEAQKALERCEAWTVEWRIYATAMHVFANLGRQLESAQYREQALRVAQRVADTLADEPRLQQSFLRRVRRDLAEHASSA